MRCVSARAGRHLSVWSKARRRKFKQTPEPNLHRCLPLCVCASVGVYEAPAAPYMPAGLLTVKTFTFTLSGLLI